MLRSMVSRKKLVKFAATIVTQIGWKEEQVDRSWSRN